MDSQARDFAKVLLQNDACVYIGESVFDSHLWFKGLKEFEGVALENCNPADYYQVRR